LYTVALCLRWLCGARMLAWMQPHGCLAPRNFSVSLNNLTNVKITTVYRRRQNTTQNNNSNPVFSSSLADWFQTSVFLLSRCIQSNVLPEQEELQYLSSDGLLQLCSLKATVHLS